MSPFVCLYVCVYISAHLYASILVSVSLCLSQCLSVHVSVCVSWSVYTCLCVLVFVCVCVSVCECFCLCLSLSVCESFIISSVALCMCVWLTTPGLGLHHLTPLTPLAVVNKGVLGSYSDVVQVTHQGVHDHHTRVLCLHLDTKQPPPFYILRYKKAH